MTTLAAKIFHMCLTAHLDAPFGANLAPGNSADVLAREFNDGLAGLLRSLVDEAAGGRAGVTLFHLLSEVWTRPDDDRHLSTPLWDAGAAPGAVRVPVAV